MTTSRETSARYLFSLLSLSLSPLPAADPFTLHAAHDGSIGILKRPHMLGGGALGEPCSAELASLAPEPPGRQVRAGARGCRHTHLALQLVDPHHESLHARMVRLLLHLLRVRGA